MPASDVLQGKPDALRTALSEALVLADGDAVEAIGLLLDAVAAHLGIDPKTLRIGQPIP